MKFQKPEVLAPGGDVASVMAALDAGADAVYLGLPRFNARSRASNIQAGDLPLLAAHARSRGARIFLTFNILFTQHELAPALRVLEEQALPHIDGIILQDLGVARLIGSRFPELEMHASTQCTTHTAAQIRFLADLGFTRVNLSRELSMPEISELTARAREWGVQTEVFVHGAFCVSMSGQCMLNSQIAGLSGNRGQCVQPCRRRWSMGNRANLPRESGTLPEHEGYNPLLNLRDLDARRFLTELLDAGVGSLKIEGRMKGPDYVSALVAEWRTMVDEARIIPEEESQATRVFNRGFSSAYLAGRPGPEQFTYRQIDRSLVILGTIRQFIPGKKQIILEDVRALDDRELRGREAMILGPEGVLRMRCEVWADPGQSRVGYRWFRTIPDQRVEPGDFLVLDRPRGTKVEDTGIPDLRWPPIPVAIELSLGEERGLTLELSTLGRPGAPDAPALREAPPRCSIKVSEAGVDKARGQGLSTHMVQEKVGILDQGLTLQHTRFGVWQEGLFLAPKAIKALRRRAVSAFFEALAQQLSIQEPSGSDSQELQKGYWSSLGAIRTASGAGDGIGGRKSGVESVLNQSQDAGSVTAWVLCDDPAVALAADRAGLTAVLDPADEGGLAWLRDHPEVWGYLDSVLLDGAGDDMLRNLPPGRPVVVGGAGGFESGFLSNRPWVAGWGWNCTNAQTLELLVDQGARGVWLSPELSVHQSREVLQAGNGTVGLGLPLFGPQRGMVLRNCFMTKAGGCGVKNFSPECVARCRKTSVLDQQEGDVQVVWVKRPLHLPEIYNGRILLNDGLLEDGGIHGDTQARGFAGIADLRNLGLLGIDPASEEGLGMTDLVLRWLKDPASPKAYQSLEQLLHRYGLRITRGSARRGLGE